MTDPRDLPELTPEDWDQYDGEVREPEPKPNGDAAELGERNAGDDGQVIEPQRRRLQPLQWAEFRGQQRREYLVKGLLDIGAFSVIYGEAGSGKTHVALDLAQHLAQGLHWHDRKTKQGSVVYIAAEGGLGLEERLEAFRLHHGVDPVQVPLYILATAVDLRNPDADIGDLINECQRLEPVAIFIDTLSRTMVGGNENSPDDMGAWVANADRLRIAIKTHVSAIHHAGKDTAKGARGHSLLRAAADTEIEVTNSDGIITATITKQRDYALGDSFAFRLEQVEVGKDEDGDAKFSCVVLPTEPTGSTAHKMRLRGQAKIALDLLKNAINEAGETPPQSAHRPDKMLSVKESLWKQYCITGRLADSDDPDNQRRAFVRVRDTLREKEVIGIWEEWVWVT